jgi:hypothetical protein
LVTHYEGFLAAHEWLANALSWTVVETPGSSSAPSARAVAAKLTGGGCPEIADDLGIRELDLYPMEAHFVGASGSAAVLLQQGGAYTNDREVLTWLSEGSRVWAISWHVNDGARLFHAVDGAIVAELPQLDPGLAIGSAPHTIANALEPLREAAALDLSQVTTTAEARIRKTTASPPRSRRFVRARVWAARSARISWTRNWNSTSRSGSPYWLRPRPPIPPDCAPPQAWE